MPTPRWSRRRFVWTTMTTLVATTTTGTAALVGCGARPAARPGGGGIIDTHIHFYDPTRPEGVPWPPPAERRLYRPVLPPEYEAIATPLGITGAVVVEASPREADNDWVLELIQRNRFLLGLVGHLKPGHPGFADQLERYAANPFLRGIRTGGWETPLRPGAAGFQRDCARLAERDLALDVLVGPSELGRVAELASAVPGLRIVVDHCANVRVDGAAPPPDWLAGLDACARIPTVHFKVSGLVEGTGRNDGTAPPDRRRYQPVINAVWDRFGPDRVLYGSNWPVSALFAPLEVVHDLVAGDAASRGAAAAARFLNTNARRVYRLSPRA